MIPATISDAIQSWAIGVVRSEQRTINVKDFGSVGDGIADDTASIQAAINSGHCIVLNPGLYRCTAPLLITKPVHIKGDGSAWSGTPGTINATDFHGSWLYFDHSGVGVSISSTVYFSDIQFSHFGTVRNQPAPISGWAPNAHDYDFKMAHVSDVYFSHMLLLNPTKGIQMNMAGAGRLFVDHLKGQPLQVGINVDLAYDVCYFNTVHFWPFWADNTFVHAYTMTNLNGFLLGRCDNPHFSSIFTIFARSGIAAYQNSYGAASKLHVINADFDRGSMGLWVQSSVTNGITGQLVNISHQGESGLAGSKGIVIQGNNSSIDITNFNSALSHQNSVRIDGTGNTINFSGQTRCKNYDQNGVGFPAIEAAIGNTVCINGTPTISGTNKYGGAGNIFASVPMTKVN